MNLIVSVDYEVVQGNGWYSFNSKYYEVKPIRIFRFACGDGAAANRYRYWCEFVGYGDMLNVHKNSAAGELIRSNINRKKNPNFKPKKLNWVGNVAVID